MKGRIVFPLRIFLLLCLLLQTVSTSNKSQAASESIPGSTSQFPPGQNVQMVGHLGGQLSTIFVQGRYAYSGFANEMAILNLDNPANPYRIAYVIFPGDVADIYVLGTFAYVIVTDFYTKLLWVVDITDPMNPKMLASLELPSRGRAVLVKGRYAYVATSDTGLRVIDVSDVSALHEVGFACASCSANDISISGNSLYLATDHEGLYIFDISNPAIPILKGQFKTSEWIVGIDVSGNYAYIVYNEGLQVVKVSNPKDPHIVSDYYLTRGMTDVIVTGVFAYVTNLSQGFAILDIGDPTHPTWNGQYISTSWSEEIALGPGYAYLASEQNGLRVISLADPYHPVEVSSYTPPVFMEDVVVDGSYAYLAGNNFTVLDISNPAMPVETGILNGPVQGSHLAIEKDDAFIAESHGLTAVNISNPYSPGYAGFISVPGGNKLDEADLVISNPYAYVVNGTGLNGIDISNPAAMKLVAEFHTSAVSIAQYQQNILLGGEGLTILDATNPLALVAIGQYGYPHHINDIEIQGHYAYLASQYGYENALDIVDISNPASPARVAYFQVPGEIGQIKVSGQFLYLLLNPHNVSSEANLKVINIADVSNPVEVGSYRIPPGYPRGVFESSGLIYVNTLSGGLYILRYGSIVAGRVLHENGSPFAGITISAGNGMEAVSDEQGYYQLGNFSPGTLNLTPSLSGLVAQPASRQVTLPPDAIQQDFTLLSAPVSTTLSPTLPATLVYTDTLGRSTLLDIPAGAVTVTAAITLAPGLAPSDTWLSFSAHAFDLAVEQDQGFVFNKPAKLTIHYGEDDLSGSREESQLAVWLWKENSWQDPKPVCGSPVDYTQDMEGNILTLPVCQAGRYALFTPSYPVYFPVIFSTH